MLALLVKIKREHLPFGPSDLNRVELENLRTGVELTESISALETDMESEVVMSISELLAAAILTPYELVTSLLDG